MTAPAADPAILQLAIELAINANLGIHDHPHWVQEYLCHPTPQVTS